MKPRVPYTLGVWSNDRTTKIIEIFIQVYTWSPTVMLMTRNFLIAGRDQN